MIPPLAPSPPPWAAGSTKNPAYYAVRIQGPLLRCVAGWNSGEVDTALGAAGSDLGDGKVVPAADSFGLDWAWKGLHHEFDGIQLLVGKKDGVFVGEDLALKYEDSRGIAESSSFMQVVVGNFDSLDVDEQTSV